MRTGRPLKFQDLNKLQQDIDNYFKECDENNKPYTVSGLAYALDTSRSTLVDYEGRDDEFSNTIKKAKEKVEKYAEEKLYSGANTAGVIFNLKNNFWWTDKQEVEAKVDSSVDIKIELSDE